MYESHQPARLSIPTRGHRHAGLFRRPLIACLALICACLTIAACEPASRNPTPPGSGFIVVVGAGQDDPLWPVLRGSALRQQNLIGETLIRTEAPPTTSANAQIELIQRLHREGARGLCVQVIDPEAISPHLKRLAASGVFVVTMWRAVEGDPDLRHTGPDQRMVGKTLADAIADAVGQEGTIAVLHADSKHQYARERHEGFSVQLKRYPRITVLREFDCGGSSRDARALMREYMERFPRLGGWVAMDNWPLRELDTSTPFLPRSCRLVAADPTPGTWNHVSSGMCQEMIATDFELMVRRAITACAAGLDGKLPKWRYSRVAPERITPENLHAFKIRWMEWCSMPTPPAR